MAEVLIKARDAHMGNNDRINAMHYRRGDPVVAMRDGVQWGDMECLPRFWKVRVEGAQCSIFEPFCHSIYAGLWTPNGDANAVVRRRWNFMPELLAPHARMALFRGDVVTIDWNTWLRCLHDKKQERGRGLILRAA